MRGPMLLVLVLALAGIAGGIWWTATRPPTTVRHPPPPDDPGLPAPARAPAAPAAAEFIGSESCRTCHEMRHETWLDTAHAYSLRAPGEETVEGRFDGRPVEAARFRAIPRRGDDGGFYVRVEARDGRWRAGDYRVSHVVGRSFEQAYLFTGPHGEWRVLPICWSIERQEWDLTHEVLHDITGTLRAVDDFDTREVVFNHGCGQCHATDYDVGYTIPEEGPPTYASTFLEGAVACESCHGPGSEHAAWHRRAEEGDVGGDAPYAWPARLVHPKRDLDARGVLDSCGRCHYLHEWRYAIDADPRVGYRDVAITLNYDQPGFFADGRIAGLRYHGTTQAGSACFTKGSMSCLSCHRMHGGKRWALKWEGDDDAQCTQCHEETTYAARTHTFHEDVRCVDCHMPKFLPPDRVLHFLRDHSIGVPEPSLTERFGSDQVPNACNQCHDDRTAGWARAARDAWWGPLDDPRLVADLETVVGLRRDPDAVPSAVLGALAARAESRLFFRLTAARRLVERDDADARAAQRALLGDAHPEVVQVATHALSRHPSRAAAPALLALLDHPVRTVRVEAAYALALAGWRDESAAREPLWRDVARLSERQGRFADILQRQVAVADALGRFEDAKVFLADLVRLAPAAAEDGLHRRARYLTETGDHEAALRLYAEVRGLMDPEDGERLRLLRLDSADSLLAEGRAPEAGGNWSALVAQDEDPVLARIAGARLAAFTGDPGGARQRLLALEAELGQEPASGELLRRVRYALASLR